MSQAHELITSGDLVIGNTQGGTLEAYGNAQISNRNSYLGLVSGSQGTAILANGARWTNSGDLNVGYFGEGVLNAQSQSTISSTNGVIGAGSGSYGQVHIETSSWTNSSGLYVGNNGSGYLTVSNSGSVIGSTAVLGYHPAAFGELSLIGGNLTVANYLVAGQLGTGILAVNGGTVTNTDGYLGLASGSYGYADLTNGSWSNSGTLSIGLNGKGYISVNPLSFLTANAINLAVASGSMGSLFVVDSTVTTSQISEGAGAGEVGFTNSTLRLSANQSALFSGFEPGEVYLVNTTIDTQAFDVTTAAAVNVIGSLTKKGSGSLTLALDGFSLGLGTITIESGSINYNLISGRSIDSILVGTGALTKTGNGTQTLNAANTYSGPTVISSGTLALGASGSFAASPIINLGTSGSRGTLDLTAKTGSFTFGANQTVSGYGTINIGAGKTVNILGNLAPGNSPGVTTFVGNLSLAPTTLSTMEIVGRGGVAGTDFDQVVLTGTLTFDGTLFINTTGLTGLAAGDSFLLFDAANYGSPGLDSVSISGTAYNPGSLSGTLGVWSVTDALSNLTFTFTEANGRLTITAIPEPAAYATLAGLGMVGVAVYRRRRAKV